ncbi:flagellin [Virgibacillus halodenitrificans]|uniref:flagellin N-terminal helical domain-containing protein n=1 Tax=Virgibacillus halodenitrificans TaxID=1482 RepID=UPI003B21CD29
MEKLSSGLRINGAADDAAGLAISEKMRGQIRGLDMAAKNAQDGISLIQTAEGALNETHSILQRMRELAVQSSNDTNTNDDRKELQKEVDQLTEELDRIANQTQFNTKDLLKGDFATGIDTTTGTSTLLAKGSVDDVTFSGLTAEEWTITNNSGVLTLTGGTSGTQLVSNQTTDSAAQKIRFGGPNGESVTIKVNDAFTAADLATSAFTVTGSGALKVHIGANENQTMDIKIDDMRVTGGNTAEIAALGTVDITNQSGAESAMTIIDDAITKVSSTRSQLGAFQNRLDHTINNLNTSSENLTAAESRIRDVDMAKEMMNQTKNSILSQAAQAMLAQANQQPQGVLQLLR